MNNRIRTITLTLGALIAAPAAAFAQALTIDNALPSVENGALIPPGLIIWLLPVAAVVSAGLFVFVDRKMRSGRTAI